jgi:hypothetical protein
MAEKLNKQTQEQEKVRASLCNNRLRKNLTDHLMGKCTLEPRSTATVGMMCCATLSTRAGHGLEGRGVERVRHYFWDSNLETEVQLEQVAAEGELYWAEPVSLGELCRAAEGGLVLPLLKLDPGVEILEGGLEDVEVL